MLTESQMVYSLENKINFLQKKYNQHKTVHKLNKV